MLANILTTFSTLDREFVLLIKLKAEPPDSGDSLPPHKVFDSFYFDTKSNKHLAFLDSLEEIQFIPLPDDLVVDLEKHYQYNIL